MRLLSTRAAPFLIFAAVALGACGDPLHPTHPAPGDANRRICQGCGGGDEDPGSGGGSPPAPPPPAPPAITGATPPASLDKDGIRMPWTVSLSSGTIQDNVTVSTSVIYGGWEVATGNQWVQCGSIAGRLTATCSMNATATFPLSGAPGGFPAGAPVTFKVYLKQGSTILASKSYGTTLFDDRPATYPFNTGGLLFINGPSRAFTATIHNPSGGLAWSGIGVRTYITQGSDTVKHITTSAALNCPGGPGVLPIGDCNVAGTYSVPTTLAAGVPGVFVIELSDVFGNIIGGTWVNVMLYSLPTIPSVKTSGALFALGGDFVADTVMIQNPNSFAVSNVSLITTVSQNGTSITANSNLNCGSGTNVLPPGNCKFIGSVPSSAMLTPGAASLTIKVVDNMNGQLATQTVPITIGALPTIDDGGLDIPASQSLVIGDPTPISFHASLGNAGSTNLPNLMSLKLIVTQGASVARTVSRVTVVCNGVTGIPVGACSLSGTLRMDDPIEDKGTLMAGGATLEFHLIDVVSGKELATPLLKGVTLK
jgi:hypothetical protein